MKLFRFSFIEIKNVTDTGARHSQVVLPKSQSFEGQHSGEQGQRGKRSWCNTDSRYCI